jgi:hypothetical protein
MEIARLPSRVPWRCNPLQAPEGCGPPSAALNNRNGRVEYDAAISSFGRVVLIFALLALLIQVS